MDRRFAPKPPRYGVMPVTCSAANVTTPTANTTTTYFLQVPYRKCYIERIYGVQNTVVSDADGTVLATFKKYDSAADSAVTLNTSASDMETWVTKEVTNITIATTNGTDKDRILQAGDSIYVEVVSNSAAFNTAPTNVCFGVELLVLE